MGQSWWALTERGHEAVAVATSTGVNTLTGEGLSDVLTGASVVMDVSNSPTLDDAPIEFFRTATASLPEPTPIWAGRA